MAAWSETREWKTPLFSRRLVSLVKNPFNGIEPGSAARGEVEGPVGMAGEPLDDLGMLVDRVVVDDGVHQLAGGHLGLDGVEEADELRVAVLLHAAADDLARGHIQRGEEGGGAVANVVVGHGAAAAALERQAGLGAVERLDLALLVDRQNLGIGRGST
jgi:hypothetical protein